LLRVEAQVLHVPISLLLLFGEVFRLTSFVQGGFGWLFDYLVRTLIELEIYFIAFPLASLPMFLEGGDVFEPHGLFIGFLEQGQTLV
jgi:hypothetical protein